MGILIDAGTFFERIGTDAERKRDRHFCARLLIGRNRIEMRKAREAGDWELMETLDREYGLIESL